PSFPVATRIQFDNIPNTTYSFAIGNPEGNYFARVLAVNANGIFSAPSNVISFSVFFNNPVPPALTRLSPPDGVTLTLPITLTWSASPNPQPSGYDLQIARDSNFQSIEDLDSQLNDPIRTVLSLTPGQKFWRVHSVQGVASATPVTITATLNGKSASGSLTVAPTALKSLSISPSTINGGAQAGAIVMLSGQAPAGGASVTLASNSAAVSPPPSVFVNPGS